MKKILFLLAALFCLAIIPLIAIYLTSSPAGEIRLPAVIGDHMVLQRNTEVRLWGWASPHCQLRIHTSWDNASHATQANDEGRWQILLPTGDATAEPQQIEIRESGNFGGRSNAVTINDILIGEVIHVHIADEFITPEGKVDIVKIRPLGRLGYFDYTTVDSVFSMRMPVSNPKQLAAMEGRS